MDWNGIYMPNWTPRIQEDAQDDTPRSKNRWNPPSKERYRDFEEFFVKSQISRKSKAKP